MLRERKFYSPSLRELNDPADCRTLVENHSAQEIGELLIGFHRQVNGDGRNDDYIRNGLQQFGAARLLDEMSTLLNTIMSAKYGVFSLTRRPDNMALWAEYADNHKGYCRVFSDLSELSYVYEVIYADKNHLA